MRLDAAINYLKSLAPAKHEDPIGSNGQGNMIRQLSLYYWLAPLLILALVAGFTTSSRGSVFNRAAGQIVNGVLVWIMLALIVSVFLFHGWKSGSVSVLAAFVVAAIGQSLFNASASRM